METGRQKTDVHYRCMDGTALFNWRFIFEFKLVPQEMKVEVKEKRRLLARHATSQFVPPVIHFQVWDNDFISSDDFIGELSLNLSKMPRPSQFSRECDLSMVSYFVQKNLQFSERNLKFVHAQFLFFPVLTFDYRLIQFSPN